MIENERVSWRPMQTNATSHNIVRSTTLGVVGTCCLAPVNERNNCQRCWRSSKEAMHSGTVLHLFLKKMAMQCFHEANIVVVPCERALHCFASDRTIEMLGFVAPKVWPVSSYTQQVPTSANIVVVPSCCWPTMLRPFAWALSCGIRFSIYKDVLVIVFKIYCYVLLVAVLVSILLLLLSIKSRFPFRTHFLIFNLTFQY